MARNPERGGGIVSSVLISLAAAFGVAVIGLGGGIGAGMVMYGPLDAPADVAPQAQGQEVQEPAKGSYIGPSLMIENGEVVWRRDSGSQGQSTPAPAEDPTNQPEDAAPVQNNPAGNSTPDKQDETPASSPQPEKPAAPAGQQPTNSAAKPAAKTPSSSAETSSGSKVAAVPNQTQPPTKSNGGTSSNNKSNGSWGEDSTTNEITGSLSRTAYWVSGGKSYHFSKSCPSLSKSTNIKTGTLQDALNAGKTDPCNNCAGGN